MVDTSCFSYTLYKIYSLNIFITCYRLNKQKIRGFLYQIIPERIQFNQAPSNRLSFSSLYQLLLVRIDISDIINSVVSKNSYERFSN